MSVRAKVFFSIAGFVTIITAANFGMIFFASLTGTQAEGTLSFQVSLFRYLLGAACFLALVLLLALPVSKKVAKDFIEMAEENEWLIDANESVKNLSEARMKSHAKMRHELRKPLNSVIRLSEQMIETEETHGEIRDNIEKIHNAGVALLSIINNTFNFPYKANESFALLPVEYDVPSLINDIVTLNAMRIGNRPIRFNVHIDEKIPRKLFGDDFSVELVCNNLLSNALLFTKEGVIDFSVSSRGEGANVGLTIRVSDTGSGFRSEELKELLSGDGYSKSGGAVIREAKMIAAMMGGTLIAESEHGKGSSFTAYIQQGFVTNAALGEKFVKNLKRFRYRADTQSDDVILERKNFTGARVLVVDDVEINLEIAKKMLEAYGMRVDCLTSGWEAIKRIREEDVRYDAIFMDQMMPYVDGFAATRFIREKIGTPYAQNIPIIALTANALEDEEQAFAEKGFQGLLAKPVDPAKLDAIVQRWLRGKETETQRNDAPAPRADAPTTGTPAIRAQRGVLILDPATSQAVDWM